MKKILILIGMVIILLISSCTPNAAPETTATVPSTPFPSATITSSPTATQTPRSTATPEPTNTSEPTTSPSNTTTPENILSEKGPWLMYHHEDGSVFLVNQDGSGRSAIPININKADYVTTSPDVSLLVIGDLGYIKTRTVYLKIFSLPELTLLQQIDLYSYLLEHSMQEVFILSPGLEFIRWSPDGRYIAFIAMIDGPSLDLYTYDTRTNQINRLTSGENQVGDMHWSPDSKWIIHEEIIRDPMGYYVNNMWAAAPDGSEVKWLYQPDQHLAQSLLGWLDNSRFLTYGHTPLEGNMEFIRMTNLHTNESSLLFSSNSLYTGPVLDTENQVLAFFSKEDEKNHLEEDGIYILPINNQTPQYTSINVKHLNFDEKQKFFYVSSVCTDENGIEGYWGFKSDGIIFCTHPTSFSSGNISPDQKWIFPYNTNELCSYPEQECIYTYGDWNSYAIWCPDSQGFFVFTSESLQYVPLDTLTPILIDDQLNSVSGTHGSSSPQWIGE